MRTLNSDLGGKPKETWKAPVLDIIAAATIQFFLSLLLLCYGLFLTQFILRENFSVKDGLWTAMAFVGTYKITSSWTQSYCKYLEIMRRKVHKRNILAFAILLCFNLASLSFYQTPIHLIIFYGVFGGSFSSIITVHLNFATAKAFKHIPKLFTFLDHVSQAVCLLIMPHLILFLIDSYGCKQVFLILSAIMLNIIPACLLISTTEPQKLKLSKFQTQDKLLSFEMKDLTRPVTHESSSSSDEDDDGVQVEEIEVLVENCATPSPVSPSNDTAPPSPVSPSNVQKYYENVGVKMLPDISEESDHDSEDDINEISSKRLSRISAFLQEMSDTPRKGSNLSVNNLYQPEELIETVTATASVSEPEEATAEVLEASPKKSCFSISSSLMFDLKWKKRRLKSFCYRHFVKSISRTVENYYFYPALISRSLTTTLSTMVFSITPYLMFRNNEQKDTVKEPNRTEVESTFLLAMMGFSWFFFLLVYPIFNKLSTCKTRTGFLVGLSLLGFSIFVVHRFSYDKYVLFSLIFGMGHAIVTYAEDVTNEEFFGQAKWQVLKGALEICTGFIVILSYLVIYYLYLDIYTVLFYAYWLYMFDVGLWIVSYIVKKIYIYCRNTQRYNLERYPDYNF